jgi:hypothetical protein
MRPPWPGRPNKGPVTVPVIIWSRIMTVSVGFRWRIAPALASETVAAAKQHIESGRLGLFE